MADDLLVGELDRAHEFCAFADLAHQRVACQRTGDFAVFVPAHAVRHQPEAEFGVGVVGVLVVLAAQADVGAVSEFDHAQDVFFPWGRRLGACGPCRRRSP